MKNLIQKQTHPHALANGFGKRNIIKVQKILKEKSL